MKRERLMGIAGTAIRSAPVVALCLGTAVALASSVHWRQANLRRAGRAPFSLVAKPGSLSVKPGGTAHYKITIHRGRYRGRIKLSLASRVTPYASSKRGGKVTIKAHGQRAVLKVKTAASARVGSYSVRVKAVGGRYKGYLTLKLKVAALKPASFTIAGNSGPLWPGVSQAVNLALTNPNSSAISVNSLVVAIKSVSAPRATTALPCSAADFSVAQFTGAYPLKVGAHATVHLSDLGVVAARGPQLRMLDRPVNQNGCQGATVTLSYSGTATSP
jgi:hypothetical protein